MKAELRGLPPEIADKVGLRLLAAGTMLEEDPEGAYAQAKVARRLAARLPIVRAAVAETAYAAGEYQAALTDYRALRRMSGGDEYLPVIADCERALGKPEEALRIAKEAAGARMDQATAIEMCMVEAGARADLGQEAEALRLLERKIRETQHARALNDTSKARLRYAYADLLVNRGEVDQARDWFSAAAKLDRDGVTGADDRIAELDGLVLDFGDDEDEDELDLLADDPDRDDSEDDDFEEDFEEEEDFDDEESDDEESDEDSDVGDEFEDDEFDDSDADDSDEDDSVGDEAEVADDHEDTDQDDKTEDM
ncbi:hypothetical protein AADG42_12195 [Ammonicoccus fulvus]|uniref:Tetratricopeptide repeat protein n=1 Tax=Ammonicoccus fulvus TaxID=3138240 RepID=A0ABZ3FTY0_9ACTN